MLLAPADVHDDVAEGSVGEGLRPVPVDHRVFGALDRPVAKRGQALLGRIAEALREIAAQRERLPEEPAPGDAPAGLVGEKALGGEPRVQVEDSVQGARSVVRDDEDVALIAREAGKRPGRLVEDPVRLGDRALEAVALPVTPAEMLDVIGSHEDDEEELGVEALSEPHGDLDFLRRGAADQVEVDLAVRDRKPVVELERAEAALQLGAQRLGIGSPCSRAAASKPASANPSTSGAGQVKGTLTMPVRLPERRAGPRRPVRGGSSR